MQYSPCLFKNPRLSRKSESSAVRRSPCSIPTGNSFLLWFQKTERERVIDQPSRTCRRGSYELKIWPNVAPDVKWSSSTPGKIESINSQETILSNHTNQNLPSNGSRPVIATVNPQLSTLKPSNIAWNDDSAYPMLDELSRIAKVCKGMNSHVNERSSGTSHS